MKRFVGGIVFVGALLGLGLDWYGRFDTLRTILVGLGIPSSAIGAAVAAILAVIGLGGIALARPELFLRSQPKRTGIALSDGSSLKSEDVTIENQDTAISAKGGSDVSTRRLTIK